RNPETGEVVRWMDHPVGEVGAAIVREALPRLDAIQAYDTGPLGIVANADGEWDPEYVAACDVWEAGHLAIAAVRSVLLGEVSGASVYRMLDGAREHLNRLTPEERRALEAGKGQSAGQNKRRDTLRKQTISVGERYQKR